ncbi:hypothetical protein V5F49_08680 [Xanthobacter sp. V3C-3]|uniref:hypothetical protein n=1 Tax=Xanthobacter lutulentifluminis TaxID=3119935 RepID=UPI0037298528
MSPVFPAPVPSGPIPPTRRGACPAFLAPMETGDGLILRLVPQDGALSPAQLRGLAAAARAFGNGMVEVTARGSLQVRGLKPETVGLLQEAVLALGIAPRLGLPVDVSPLSGLDPTERADARPLAARVADAAEALAGRLGPKVSVVIDGGGAIRLDGRKADIRLAAVGDGVWSVTIGGGDSQALDTDAACSRTLEALAAIAARGPGARASDLAEGWWRAAGHPVLDRDAPAHHLSEAPQGAVRPADAAGAPSRAEMPAGVPAPVLPGREAAARQDPATSGSCHADAAAAGRNPSHTDPQPTAPRAGGAAPAHACSATVDEPARPGESAAAGSARILPDATAAPDIPLRDAGHGLGASSCADPDAHGGPAPSPLTRATEGPRAVQRMGHAADHPLGQSGIGLAGANLASGGHEPARPADGAPAPAVPTPAPPAVCRMEADAAASAPAVPPPGVGQGAAASPTPDPFRHASPALRRAEHAAVHPHGPSGAGRSGEVAEVASDSSGSAPPADGTPVPPAPAKLRLSSASLPAADRLPPAPLGAFPLADGSCAVGIGLPFGAGPAELVEAIADLADAAGARDLRPAPERVLLVTGLGPAAVAGFAERAGALGLIVAAGDPRAAVAACPGAPACASAHFPARAMAAEVATALAGLLDGSVSVHLSACTKGCARPTPATLTLAGMDGGIALVHEGRAVAAVGPVVAVDDLPARLAVLAGARVRCPGASGRELLRRLDLPALWAGTGAPDDPT